MFFPDCFSTLSCATINSSCLFLLFWNVFPLLNPKPVLDSFSSFQMIGCRYLGLCLLMVSQQVSEVRVPSCTSQGCFRLPGHVQRLAGVLSVRLLFRIFPDHLWGCSHHHLINTALRCIPPLVPFVTTDISLSCLSVSPCSAIQRCCLNVMSSCWSDPPKWG